MLTGRLHDTIVGRRAYHVDALRSDRKNQAFLFRPTLDPSVVTWTRSASRADSSTNHKSRWACWRRQQNGSPTQFTRFKKLPVTQLAGTKSDLWLYRIASPRVHSHSVVFRYFVRISLNQEHLVPRKTISSVTQGLNLVLIIDSFTTW